MKKPGFTLIELLIASTISITVMVISFAVIGNIYFARKQIRIAQNFYSESRFLLEKIVTISRENTIDYDRYFIEVGPDPTSCASFPADQSNLDGNVAHTNTKLNREASGYPNIFYWKISDEVYRSLGGTKIDGGIDPCSQAFHSGTDSPLVELYLINEERSLRTAIKNKDSRIRASVELGADTDNDGKADLWGSGFGWNNGECKIIQPYSNDATTPTDAVTIIQDEALCYSAHGFENISAKKLTIDNFSFTPHPDRDPFLNFRNDDAQIHPNVFLFMKIGLKDYQGSGFASRPTITMQTSVSSRVFKNTRE